MSKSYITYRCLRCQQSMNAKGWGSHVGSSQCDHDKKVYEQGFKAAKSAMFGKLNKVKP